MSLINSLDGHPITHVRPSPRPFPASLEKALRRTLAEERGPTHEEILRKIMIDLPTEIRAAAYAGVPLQISAARVGADQKWQCVVTTAKAVAFTRDEQGNITRVFVEPDALGTTH